MEPRWEFHRSVLSNYWLATNPFLVHISVLPYNTGAAFTKHLIHLYACQGPNDLRQQTEVSCQDVVWEFLGLVMHLTTFKSQIEAHSGSVNDLAFAYPNKQLSIVTCGDDKLIKVDSVSHDFFMLKLHSFKLSLIKILNRCGT